LHFQVSLKTQERLNWKGAWRAGGKLVMLSRKLKKNLTRSNNNKGVGKRKLGEGQPGEPRPQNGDWNQQGAAEEGATE